MFNIKKKATIVNVLTQLKKKDEPNLGSKRLSLEKISLPKLETANLQMEQIPEELRPRSQRALVRGKSQYRVLEEGEGSPSKNKSARDTLEFTDQGGDTKRTDDQPLEKILEMGTFDSTTKDKPIEISDQSLLPK